MATPFDDLARRESDDEERYHNHLRGAGRSPGWRTGPGAALIDPTQRERGRPVFYRDYRKADAGVSGEWIEGRIAEIGRMFVQVEFAGGTRDMNRVDLYWGVP